MWGPNPNRNPNYGGPWLWRAVTPLACYSISFNFYLGKPSETVVSVTRINSIFSQATPDLHIQTATHFQQIFDLTRSLTTTA